MRQLLSEGRAPGAGKSSNHTDCDCLEHFHFENALLTRKRQPPQRGVHSGENRVFRLNATFDFHKKSKVICSRAFCS
ncbi:hypothetical protein [Desulfovibrio sp. ZJ200]|uniref:hypothetical protein n=1 Tax=Desulfovibrio sp. ZJ200 TaxID=2709792 RepID=UPI0013EA8A07|nr:hypothetical protein [Desulfovibrio sp. ZJ200]